MKAGWNTKTLGDVCDFLRGLTYAKSDEVAVSNNIVLRATNIDLETHLLDLTELKYINDKVAVPSGKKVRKGSLLICTASGSKSHLGKVALIDDDYDFAFGGFMGMLTPCSELAPKFLFHLMTSGAYKDFIAALSDGANINNLKFSDLQRFVVPVPPLPEQQRIVAILDEAFEAIAAARTNAEQNRQNARALFDTFLNAVYLGGDAGAWPLRRLGDVFDIGSSKRIHERDWSPSGVPFYGGKEIVKLAKFGHAVSNAYISEQMYQDFASKYDMPKAGDILITARGTIGVGYVVKRSDKFYYKDGNIISMRAKEAANPHYLLYAFRSNALADQLGVLSGTTVTHLPLEKAKKLLLRMPEIGIQDAVVKRIMKFEAETQRLESLYQRKIAALDELKQSLLQQAFSGQL